MCIGGRQKVVPRNPDLCRRFAVSGRVVGHELEVKGYWLFNTIYILLVVELDQQELEAARAKMGGFHILDHWKEALPKTTIRIKAQLGERPDVDDFQPGQEVMITFGYSNVEIQHCWGNEPIMILAVAHA